MDTATTVTSPSQLGSNSLSSWNTSLIETKVTDSVWIEQYDSTLFLNGCFVVHNCEHIDDNEQALRQENSGVMHLRRNNQGPNYWCAKCGYVLDEGASMAVRLFEIKI
jgi:hypothetical protein